MAGIIKSVVDTVAEDVRELGDYLTTKVERGQEKAENLQQRTHETMDDAQKRVDATRRDEEQTGGDTDKSVSDRMAEMTVMAGNAAQGVKDSAKDAVNRAGDRLNETVDRTAQRAAEVRDETQRAAEEMRTSSRDAMGLGEGDRIAEAQRRAAEVEERETSKGSGVDKAADIVDQQVEKLKAKYMEGYHDVVDNKDNK